jgi:uncharacterized protein (TIGR03067 family)
MKTKSLLLAFVSAIASLMSNVAFAGRETISPDSDLGRLQGRWTARAGARGDVRVVLQIDGRKVDASINTPQGIRFRLRGTLKLDESTTPRSLDWLKFSGADQQEFPDILGIYKINRETFTICNGGLNGPRPKEFKSGEGVLSEVIVFERERIASAAKEKRTPQAAR